MLGVDVQVGLMDPFMFLIVCFGFFVLFFAFMYSKGMLWFQQTEATETNTWLDTYRAKDELIG